MKKQNLVQDFCDDSSDYAKEVVHPVQGDYVLVSFKSIGKANPRFYIGLVESIDEETGKCEVKFLKKCKVDHMTGQPTFIFKEDDECFFPESDIVKILPLPYVTGITSKQKKFVFPIIFIARTCINVFSYAKIIEQLISLIIHSKLLCLKYLC